MFKFEELNVYKESLSFVTDVYKLTKDWPKFETYGLGDQFRRAAVSISLNIAEGSSRKINDFRHFLDISRGSCYECVSILKISFGEKYIDEDKYTYFYNKLEMMSKMISGLKNSLSMNHEH